MRKAETAHITMQASNDGIDLERSWCIFCLNTEQQTDLFSGCRKISTFVSYRSFFRLDYSLYLTGSNDITFAMKSDTILVLGATGKTPQIDGELEELCCKALEVIS